MAENWPQIAAEVALAIAGVGFPATLEIGRVETGPDYDPTTSAVTTATVQVLDEQIRARDASGTTAGEVRRVLTIAATGPVPVKGARIQVHGVWHRIMDVATTSPGGTDLMYEMRIGT